MTADGFDILVCKGPVCAGRRNADEVYQAMSRVLVDHAVGARVQLGRRKCFGRCQRGPNVYVRARRNPGDDVPRPRSALYNGVGLADIDGDIGDILTSHVGAGIVVTRLIQRSDSTAPTEDNRLATAMRALVSGSEPEPAGSDSARPEPPLQSITASATGPDTTENA